MARSNITNYAFLDEDAKNYFATVSRTLDTLYKMAEDATATPAYRADFACRLAAYRACVRSADLMRYDAAREASR